MPEMPSECGIKEEVAKAYALGFTAGALAFYGSGHAPTTALEVKKLYIRHAWNKLERAGELHPDYVIVRVAGTSSEKAD